MNQPTGMCHVASLYQDHSNIFGESLQGDNVVPISSDIAAPDTLYRPHDPESDPEPHTQEDIGRPPSPAPLPFDSGYQESENIGMDLDDTDGPQKITETFPGCSDSYPGGSTFMDFFWQDKYAREREENLYYPFASEEEWQFSSWCSRSGLSMAALDGLLSLPIVSVYQLLPGTLLDQ